jgi:predicted cupin superfamily sugar epimerase
MHPDAERIVRELGLAPHPEGGFYRETFRSPRQLDGLPNGPRAASTAIYFLLPAGSFSAFHAVTSDEAWHHYDGDPLELQVIGTDGVAVRYVLGKDLAQGQVPQAVVPAGAWQAARPLGERYALVGCTVSPGFDFTDFEMPPRAELLRRLPAHRELVERFTRE